MRAKYSPPICTVVLGDCLFIGFMRHYIPISDSFYVADNAVYEIFDLFQSVIGRVADEDIQIQIVLQIFSGKASVRF